MQIWEITGGGKQQTMPPQQEHILFEECMYLCVHHFETSAGSKLSEAYLWCGDAVSEAAVEDAQLFCRRTARENAAKLEVLKQGKESSNFFQALGGILIVRRSKAASLYMLCGRRHLGHIAFDEVDMSAACLCPGFSFLISAKFGKLYLWKGRGACADEVGCARLIGMDLGLTGEMEEVVEGEEPASFWEALSSKPGKDTTKWNPHWATRETHRGFPSRLYRIEQEQPRGIANLWGFRAASPPKAPPKLILEEITPYSQKDLEAGHVYILDSYSNIHV